MFSIVFWIWISLAIIISILFIVSMFSVMLISGQQAQYEEDRLGMRRS